MPIAPSLRHCSNKYKLAREGEKDKEKDYDFFFFMMKTIIDTLHKEGKPQTFIAKEAGCSQSAVSKHVNRTLSGRKRCGRKRCTTNRENRSFMRIVKQNRFKNLGELHKEWTEAGVKTSRATTHRRVEEFDYSCLVLVHCVF